MWESDYDRALRLRRELVKTQNRLTCTEDDLRGARFTVEKLAENLENAQRTIRILRVELALEKDKLA